MAGAWKIDGEGIILFARVTPSASKDRCGGLWRGAGGEERLVLRVTAPPDKGRANAAAVRLLARTLGLPKSAISIAAGEKDRLKSFALRGDSEQIIGKVEALLREEGSGGGS